MRLNTGVSKACDKTLTDSNGANFNSWAEGALSPGEFAGLSSLDEASHQRRILAILLKDGFTPQNGPD